MYDHKSISWVLWLLMAGICFYFGFGNSNYFAVAVGIACFAWGLSSLANDKNSET